MYMCCSCLPLLRCCDLAAKVVSIKGGKYKVAAFKGTTLIEPVMLPNGTQLCEVMYNVPGWVN
jgi:hypothetical protein